MRVLAAKAKIKRACCIITGAVFLMSLSGCLGVNRSRFSKIISMPEEAVVPEYMAKIIGYASLAPSSHNTQPWKVKVISDSELIIEADHSRNLGAVDPRDRELVLSIGAFWEGLEQAATSFGYEVGSEILAQSPGDAEMLKIRFVQTALEKRSNVSLLKERATDRKPFRKKRLSLSNLEELKEVIFGHFYYFPRTSDEGRWIAENLIEANKKQVYADAKQKELAEWLRFSPAKAKLRGDGITAEALGLSYIERLYWYDCMDKKSVLSESFRRKTIERVTEQVNNCAGFIAIVSADSSVESLLLAGKEFQRLSLKCAALNISLHPMSQVIEELPWSQQLKEKLNVDGQVQFIIRAGHPKGYPAASIRRNIEDFVTYDKDAK